MRLGELLVADGRLTDEQIEQALRAQVLWGGRLGTNLVELGLLDLDELSWALARLHSAPVALARHFARTDVGLQARLGASLAEKWQCIPLARLADDPPRIGIAAVDPLSPEAIAEIAAALGEPLEAIVGAVAAEMRILYHLELSYGIARPARYLRTKDAAPPEAPAPVTGESSEVEIELPPQAPPEVEPLPRGEPAELPLALSDEADRTSPEQRRYMPMVGDEERRVGRIAIRKVAVFADEAQGVPASWPDALRAIRRAHDRDRVGELAVAALTRFGPTVELAALLVVRGAVAIGWRGLGREGALDLRSVAVPLDQPSLIATAVATGAPSEGDLAGGDDVDHRLAAALGSPAPCRALVSPISLSEGRVACVLVCHTRGGPADAEGARASAELVEQLAAVVASMRSAFLRLIRAASR